ncbi:MAG TPA: tyrosine-type recombinase/integrase [Syntrophorhabdus sp.]|nr:tyrosine-type recombinase/integrase [Syntrophorhabdus sp.]
MTGLIICNKCRKKMDGVCLCTPEGNQKCIVKVYWKGARYEYRRDDKNIIFTYDTATAKLTDISNQIRKGIFNPVDHTDAKVRERKFEHQIELWLEEKDNLEKAGELSLGTTSNYHGYAKNHFYMLNDYDVRDIQKGEITTLKDSLSGVSIKTRKNILRALQGFFRWMYERGTITAIPLFPEVKGDDSKQRQAIDFELQDKALETIPGEYRDPIEFLYETGLRPAEACALLVKHIDIHNRLMLVERTYVKGNKIKESTKQKKKRIMPLSDRAVEIASKHLIDKHPHQFLFINPRTGKGLLPKVLWYQWHKYSNLDVCLYEGTRHSFGSQLIQNNDVTHVQALMGHSDIRTTMKYLHLKMDKLSDAVNARKKVLRLVNRTKIEPNINEGEN